MNRNYKYGMAFGILMLLGIILITFLWDVLDPMVVTIALAVGIVLVASSVVRFVKYRDLPEKDERTVKISNTALAYSWFVTLIFVCVLFWADYLGKVQVTVAQALGAVYFVMIVVAMIFIGYFKRRGDV